MSKHKYKAKAKFRFSDTEAQIIGDAFEQCGSEIGARGVSVEQFEEFCSKPKHAVHAIWERRKVGIEEGAGRSAAAYLMRAVQIVIIHEAPVPMGRAFTTIRMASEDGEPVGVGYRSEQVSRSPDLLDAAEADSERQIRGLAESFAALAGADRMRALMLRVIASVEEVCLAAPPPRKKHRPVAKEARPDA